LSSRLSELRRKEDLQVDTRCRVLVIRPLGNMAQVADHEVVQQDRRVHKHLLEHGLMGIEELPEWLDVDAVLSVELLEVVFRLHGVEPDEGGKVLKLGCHPKREVVHVDERSWLPVTHEVGPPIPGREAAFLALDGDDESLAFDPACPLDAGRCDICPGAVRLSRLHHVILKVWISLDHLQRALCRVVDLLETPIAC